jgi:anti-anti-sigma factor
VRGRLSVDFVDNDDAARIIIRGEADIANADHLATALAGIALDGARSVQLHVSDLAFIDVSSLRLLTAFAGRMKQEGRAVETHGAGPMLQRVALELDVHDELGLRDQDPTSR